MNTYDVKRLTLALAIQAEIEAMKFENIARENNGMSHAYNEEEFWIRAEMLNELANAHEEQI